MRRKPGIRIRFAWNWRDWIVGFAGPYIGYNRTWWDFYFYLGPLSIDIERVKEEA